MKILHLSNYYMEGFGYQENWLPYHQQKQGHTVLFLTSDRWFPLPNYEQSIQPIHGDRIKSAGVIEDKGVKIIRKPVIFEWSQRAITLFRYYREMKLFAPDAIHLHGATNFNMLPALIYSMSNNKKLFIDCHQDFLVTRYESLANKLNYWLWRYWYKLIARRIARFLPITDGSRAFLVDMLGVKPDHCTVCHLGADLDDKSYDAVLDSQFRAVYGLEQYKVVVNAGKQYPEKNILFILETYQQCLSRCGDTKIALILIGESSGDYEQKIVQLIKIIENGCQNAKIIRLPFMKNDQLNQVYSCANIGIWPGVASNTIQEAMACDTVVALLDSASTSHLAVDQRLVIKELNAEHFSMILTGILCDDIELATLKEKTRALIQQYSWASIAEKTVQVYQQ